MVVSLGRGCRKRIQAQSTVSQFAGACSPFGGDSPNVNASFDSHLPKLLRDLQLEAEGKVADRSKAGGGSMLQPAVIHKRQ